MTSSPLRPGGEDDTFDRAERNVLASIFRRSMFWMPERQAPSAWTEHLPFAFWLVDVLRPGRIVELGTYNGVSYSAMCQAVKTLGLATSCFAIDTWAGDEHAGFYEEDVYRSFAAFHDPRYGSFSRLVRSTFDEALRHFEDGSIDLLHIDGLHTYDAVKHDCRSWLPKVSANGVVLFHDTNVREREFGVFRLWSEISAGKPHFSFLHGHGLGVLGCGRDYPDALRVLFDANNEARHVSALREVFGMLGGSLGALMERSGLHQTVSKHSRAVDTLLQTLAAREDEIASLKRQLAESVDKLAQDANKLGMLNRELAVRNTEVDTARDAEIRLSHALMALHRSSSWRVTAPLRAVSTCVRRFARLTHRVLSTAAGRAH